ncbi:MAG: transcription-repair coupling factor [bacterium]
MTLSARLATTVADTPSVKRVQELISEKQTVNVTGVAGALKSLLLINLLGEFQTHVVYIAPDLEEIEAVKEEVALFLNQDSVAFFSAEMRHKYGVHFSSNYTRSAQLFALESLVQRKQQVLVAHCSALKLELPTSKEFLGQKISISEGEPIDFEKLIVRLVDLGFIRQARAESPGEMSVRGGIVDVYPFSSEHPYRIEFWGDNVESLRQYDPVSQRSLHKKKRLKLFPQDLDLLHEDGQECSDLLGFLRDDAIVVLDEPDLIRKAIAPQVVSDAKNNAAALDELSDEACEQLGEWKKIQQKIARFRNVNIVSFGKKGAGLVDFNSRRQDSLKGNLKLLRESLIRLTTAGLGGHTAAPAIFYLCESSSQVERVNEIFHEEKIESDSFVVAALGLHSGFIFPEANLVVLTDHQFYGRKKRLRLPKKSPRGLTLKQFRSLSIGDYVVHVDFGIGVFRGLKRISVKGHERECLHLEYKDGDNLYVRFERMDRVHKYSSKDGMKPALSKLGSAEWQKLKSRTKKKIKDIANELIEIYAKRKSQPGFSFATDSLWQRELEASFPYEDTPDQMKATQDVKRDMESPKPMDRLVCGDVGFGKTEIAVRAAFKTVLSGKQVAILVPTTILAYQHYNTFQQRLEKFPVQIEMLSRFRTPSEQKKIVEKIKQGSVDIIIGTHRILSNDVEFKDVGLLVIDEEQRFGVRHKERLKKIKAHLDVLTLTATPIPRTLHLSLMGARDITNIYTAPKNRLPIFTEIMPFNKVYIREVILNELERGGQVFFVHNQVRTIDRVATMLSRLVPEANIVVAHGQMPEAELEQVMIKFMQKKYHILVSTTIIESGLDIPNVNTIIIERADKFGLAQLYQLRGRVGRSHQRAYAYFLIPPVETMTEDALKRLRAIEEFSEIGSGSQLAMRDLEIRGAGNLLGAEQTGFIDALGFELYNKILDDAVSELKKDKTAGDPSRPEVETHIEIDTDAYLPEDYISSGPERVDIYRRMIDSTAIEQLDDLTVELEDRFGRLPQPVKNLLNYLALRIIGKSLCLQSIEVVDGKMVAEFSPKRFVDMGEPFKKWLGKMVEHANVPFEFLQRDGIGLRLNLEERSDNLLIIKEFLQSVSGIEVEEGKY